MGTKVCSICGYSGPMSEFCKGRNRCKQCESKRTRAKTIRNIDKLYEYLSSKQCSHCGLSDPRILEFHHTDSANKLERVAYIKSHPWSKIQDEINKCIVLCSNCHRIEHSTNGYGRTYRTKISDSTKYIECTVCGTSTPSDMFYPGRTECIACTKDKVNSRVNEGRLLIRSYVEDRGCSICGNKDYKVLDLHHKDPNTKLRKVSAMKSYSADAIRAEMYKCDVLCSNCHRIEHSTKWYIPSKEVSI